MCELNFTDPQTAYDACMRVFATTPNWPSLLMYGVAFAAGVGALGLGAIWLFLWLMR